MASPAVYSGVDSAGGAVLGDGTEPELAAKKTRLRYFFVMWFLD